MLDLAKATNMNKEKIEKWEKEFDKAEKEYLIYPTTEQTCQDYKTFIKQFIKDLIKTQREDIIGEIDRELYGLTVRSNGLISYPALEQILEKLKQ